MSILDKIGHIDRQIDARASELMKLEATKRGLVEDHIKTLFDTIVVEIKLTVARPVPDSELSHRICACPHCQNALSIDEDLVNCNKVFITKQCNLCYGDVHVATVGTVLDMEKDND